MELNAEESRKALEEFCPLIQGVKLLRVQDEKLNFEKRTVAFVTASVASRGKVQLTKERLEEILPSEYTHREQ